MLASAGGAFVGEPRTEPVAARAPAGGAAEPVRPFEFEQMIPSRKLAAEAALEGRQVRRQIARQHAHALLTDRMHVP